MGKFPERPVQYAQTPELDACEVNVPFSVSFDT